jgi:hypothetical protein
MKKFFAAIFIVLLFSLTIFISGNFGDFQRFFTPRFFISQVSPGSNEALFYLSPGSGSFNGAFSADLRINTSVAITSVKAYLNFPASVVSVSSIDTSGSAFGNLWESTFNNTTGKIQIQASLASPGYQGSTGLIARINFQAVAAGAASVTYDPASLALKIDDTNVLNLTSSQSANFTIDTTPPIRSAGLPTGTLSSGTTQTTMSLTTNESATCKYGTVSASYASLPNTFTTTGSTSHSQTITGLTNGTSYTYYIRCQDTAGNSNTDNFTISFSVAAPSCTNCGLVASVVTPAGPTANQSFTITCGANDTGYDCVDAYVNTTLCTFSQWSGNNAIFSCSGLSVGSYTAKCTAKIGTSRNCCADEKTTAFNVQAPSDITPPVRSGGQPSGILTATTTQTTISLTTNESATCKYGTVSGTAYASLLNTFSTTTGGTSHSSLITGLTGGSAYTYYVRCRDAAGNANTDDLTITFSVALPVFTISNVSPLYLFRDQSNTLTVSGTNFTLSNNFSLRFASGTVNVSSITVQPLSSTAFTISLNSAQVNTLSVGFYDLKLERSADSQLQTYSQKILITLAGDISGSTPGVRDGKIDIYDVSRLMSKWGSTNSADLVEYDINPGPGNISVGKIDLYDANKMMANWRP